MNKTSLTEETKPYCKVYVDCPLSLKMQNTLVSYKELLKTAKTLNRKVLFKNGT